MASSVAGHWPAALMGGAAIFAASVEAQVMQYPTKTVRMIIPFVAGGPVEIPARSIGQRLTESLGQQFVVENRPGATGIIGSEIVAKSPSDGYTLLFTSCAHAANPAFYKKLPYDTLNDFSPITQTNVTYGNVLAIHPSTPARSVKEFIALAKSMPGKLNYGSSGIGSPQHVNAALFASMTGTQLTHVPYKGTSTAFNDLLGGHLELMFVSPPHARPYILAGKVRALGIGGPRRNPQLADLPTFHEAGLSGFDVTCYHGMWFPAATPTEIVRRLNSEVAKALAHPDVRRLFADSGIIPVGNTPEEFAEVLMKDVARQATIAKIAGILPQ